MSIEQSFDMEKEFEGLDFNSIRLEKRFVRTMETLSRQPGKSIWFCSENLDREDILRTHREATVNRMVQSGKTILAVQDTTSLNYNTHAKMKGIGYISDKTLGVNIHTCLAVTTDGLVLGVLSQSSYNRAEAKSRAQTHDVKKTRPLAEKESYRWVKALETSAVFLPEGVKAITVCDQPCTAFFEEDEWKALYCVANKTKKSPKKLYTIAEAVTYLSWLGGPKRSPSDGPPGVITIWIGLEKLNSILAYKEWCP